MMRASTIPIAWRLVQLVQSSRLYSSSIKCSASTLLTTHPLACIHRITVSVNMDRSVPCCFYHVTAKLSNKKDRPASEIKLEEVHLFSSQDEDLGVMPRSRAKLIADAENLKLVRILSDEQDDSEVPLYKIMGGKEISQWKKQERELKRQSKTKSRKTLKINSSISEHDLKIKIRHALELLTKGHEIRIVIRNVSAESKGASGVFQQLTDACKELAVVKQAQQSLKELIFLLKPRDVDDNGLQIPPHTYNITVEETFFSHDWVRFEEIANPEERAYSQFFETMMSASRSGTGQGAQLRKDVISCRVSKGDNNDGCDVCGEDFEQFYDDEEEGWHLKDAVRAGEKIYHPVCYNDAKETGPVGLLDPETPQLETPMPDPVALRSIYRSCLRGASGMM